uniref:Branched-chain amino acid aminotransferase n=1 Tax=Thermoproteus uzoniensis (strain 768-20) TaxID=999630 RepID=UPI0007717320|nr:Chain A, Branched-chain amino acid aminotransferase [Thermoproteus uzoniensis 768-20]5CE8_B Chain B, Branched-chain amino acid aminotransferase [Thermoproteus uzoniensis 768-20]5CE8_C Chain C, Branched-chain amino acid aminotransferase [Thermoproteus uzoniensis 768-20]6THQ_A Chain A, Branched-chain-amino-acid aminotransferase [Thermoproteus uzoniensis 768-20]6THQ_B Chain B, Branched-chain-amino-acid aminotransferase [Thermoproteus uzoniensis 768-20]6THQ_C Chain C, Branched-chain-amino-acid 
MRGSHHHHHHGSMKVWLDGRLVDEEEAKVTVLSPSLNYGFGVFEGIRAYWNGENLYVFRLRDHMERLLRSAKIIGLDVPYTAEELSKAVVETVRANGFKEDLYIRPVAYISKPQISLDVRGLQASVAIAAIPFGKYLKVEGVRAAVVSWRRVHTSMMPVMAKATGIYLNSIMAAVEARARGYDEAIMLNAEGKVVEGSGENIFIVRRGVLMTPPLEDGILEGITRETVISIAGDLGIPLLEKSITREELYAADEAFFVGTAAEITPIIEIDGRVLQRGPITQKIAETYRRIVLGKEEKYLPWLTPVY